MIRGTDRGGKAGDQKDRQLFRRTDSWVGKTSDQTDSGMEKRKGDRETMRDRERKGERHTESEKQGKREREIE